MLAFSWPAFPRLALIVLFALGLAACSSTPDEEPMDGAGMEQTTGIEDSGGATVAMPTVSGSELDSLFSGSDAPPGTQTHLRETVGDTILFGYDRSDLSPEARAILDRQAQWMMAYPNVRITVAGHADERGTRVYNLALGERRAAAVRNYLTALGIPASRVEVISYGKERPVALGSDESAWRLNRRAVTEVQ